MNLDADVRCSVPSLLACLTVQFDMIRGSDGARRRILQQKIETCLLALEFFKESWPFVEKIYSLFQSRLDSLSVKEQNQDLKDSESNHPGLNISSGLDSPIAQLPVDNISTDALTSTAGLSMEASEWFYPDSFENPASAGTSAYESFQDQFTAMNSFDLIDEPIDTSLMGLGMQQNLR